MVSLESFNQESFDDAASTETTVLPFTQAGSILDALSAATCRAIMRELCRKPNHPSALADRVDTSVQNATYHLATLQEADLVEVVGTRYSTRGHEMDVYAPTNLAIVIEVGDDDPATGTTPDRSGGQTATVTDGGCPSTERDHQDRNPV